MHVPAYYPPAYDARLGDDGAVWLRSPDRNRWAIHQASGAFVGHVDLPPLTIPLHVSERGAWAVMYDSLNAPTLIRYAFGSGAGD